MQAATQSSSGKYDGISNPDNHHSVPERIAAPAQPGAFPSKVRIQWPRGNQSSAWAWLDQELSTTLTMRLKGSTAKQLSAFCEIVHSLCLEKVGEEVKTKKSDDFYRPPLTPAVRCWPWGVFSSWLASRDLRYSALQLLGESGACASNNGSVRFACVNIFATHWNLMYLFLNRSNPPPIEHRTINLFWIWIWMRIYEDYNFQFSLRPLLIFVFSRPDGSIQSTCSDVGLLVIEHCLRVCDCPIY